MLRMIIPRTRRRRLSCDCWSHYHYFPRWWKKTSGAGGFNLECFLPQSEWAWVSPCLEGRGESCSSSDKVLRHQLDDCQVCRYRPIKYRQQNIGRRSDAYVCLIQHHLRGTIPKQAVHSIALGDTVMIAVTRICGGNRYYGMRTIFTRVFR